MKIYTFIRLFILIVCLSWMVNIQVNATHIVGGEIYYEHQSGNDYLITLKVYRDCGPDNTLGTGFDDEAAVGVYNGSFYTVYTLSLFDAVVSYVPITLDNPCFTPPFDLCIEEAIYTQVVNLPPNPQGYEIVYQRCCRNNSIINILNADDSGITVFSHVPGTNEISGVNSAPIFNNTPPVALCLDAEFFFDHSATDADGDELVYEFYTPFLGGGPNGAPPAIDSPSPNPPSVPGFSNVAWASGYDVNNQINSSPNFTINSNTGLITGTATAVGRFAIGVAVHEYRNGVFINTTYRDFQYNVTVCDPTIVAAMTVDEQLYCDGLTFNFINESINGGSFYWDFGDPNSDTDNSTEFNPSYTYTEAGTYEVMLVANPGWFCADTTYGEYSAVESLTAQIGDPEYECIADIIYYSFSTADENPATATYEWDFGAGATPQFSDSANPSNVVFDSPGTHEISVHVTDFDCDNTQNFTLDIPEPPVPAIEPQDDFCSGLTYSFVNNSQGAETYTWDFDDNQSPNNNSTLFEPTHTFSDTGVYQVTLVASVPLTCPVSITEEFTITPEFSAYFEPPGGQCLSDNIFDLDFGGNATSNSNFQWQFDQATPSSSSLVNPLPFSYNEAGVFPVSLTVSNEFCEKNYVDSAYVFQDPSIGFTIGEANGCVPLQVDFEDQSFSENTLYYLWDFGDGGQSVSANPSYIYEEAGTFDVTLTAYTLSGCIVSMTQTNEAAVVVQPKPLSNFMISPPEVDILEPNFEVEDLSEGASSVEYFYENQLISTENDFPFSIQDSGEHFITQEAISEYGCKSESTFGVVVTGHLIYVPNAFSPNNDGINDYFQVKSSGIVEFEMEIYNRWGMVIYRSTDVNDVWMGNVNGGEYYAQNETYTYHITYLGQFSTEATELIGTIIVVR